MRRIALARLVCALVGALAPALAASHAHADDGGSSDVRVNGRCTAGAAAELRVRTRDDGELRLDLVLRGGRPPARWLVVVVHERRIAFRGRIRAEHGSSRATLRRELPDLFGSDRISVRATGPGALSCRATASVDGE